MYACIYLSCMCAYFCTCTEACICLLGHFTHAQFQFKFIALSAISSLPEPDAFVHRICIILLVRVFTCTRNCCYFCETAFLINQLPLHMCIIFIKAWSQLCWGWLLELCFNIWPWNILIIVMATGRKKKIWRSNTVVILGICLLLL